MPSAIRIGTSGWVYPHWRGLFYPVDLPQRQWLAFYARHFDTVELNYSFYRLPSRESVENWQAWTPPGFAFAVKGSRYVTHLKRLSGAALHVDRLLERATALGRKLGPILWQLPPSLRRDDGLLDEFLSHLPATHRYAIEFRDDTWLVEPVYAILERHGIALCLASSRGRAVPPETRLTTNWTYLRFHAGLADGDYGEPELERWAGLIAGFCSRDTAVFAYFNNDVGGYAVRNAARLQELLGVLRRDHGR